MALALALALLSLVALPLALALSWPYPCPCSPLVAGACGQCWLALQTILATATIIITPPLSRCVGGLDDRWTALAETECLPLESQQVVGFAQGGWTELNPMLHPRADAGCAAIQNFQLVG